MVHSPTRGPPTELRGHLSKGQIRLRNVSVDRMRTGDLDTRGVVNRPAEHRRRQAPKRSPCIRAHRRTRRPAMSVMTTDGAPDVLLVEFELARLDLAAATAALRHKDTPAARGEVAHCRARIDRILDSWNAGVRVPL